MIGDLLLLLACWAGIAFGMTGIYVGALCLHTLRQRDERAFQAELRRMIEESRP